jgi:multiple sugar transport system substrate-binding protein
MPSDVGEDWQGTAFGKGRLAMVFEGSWLISHLDTQFPNAHYGTVVPPKGPAGVGNLIFCVACAMSKNAKHPDAAWTLINYLTSEESQKAMMESGIALPSRVALKDSAYFKKNPRSATFLRGAARGARLFYWGVIGSVVNDQISQALEGIMKYNQSPSDAFRSAAAVVRSALASQ